jgi:phosphatidylglycerophosphatase C
MKLFLFDFDGTISKNDSFINFSLFSVNFIKVFKYWFFVIVLFPFREKSYLKEMFYLNFRHYKINTFNAICLRYNEEILEKSIKESFLDYIHCLDKSDKKVVVSASIKNYLKPWCDKNGFYLISTELEVTNGKLSGRFSTPNCIGEEKARRIKEKYDLSLYDEIHVFGNSKGDFPMLELGTHKYFKFFK